MTSGVLEDQRGVSEREAEMIKYNAKAKGTSMNVSTLTLEEATGSQDLCYC